MQIKLVESCLSLKKLEQEVNKFINSADIKVLEMHYKPTIFWLGDD